MYITLEIPHQLPPKAFVFANREEALRHYDSAEAQEAVDTGEYDDAIEFAGRDLHILYTFDSADGGHVAAFVDSLRGHQRIAARSSVIDAIHQAIFDASLDEAPEVVSEEIRYWIEEYNILIDAKDVEAR